jgi:hypothetical protein
VATRGKVRLATTHGIAWALALSVVFTGSVVSLAGPASPGKWDCEDGPSPEERRRIDEAIERNVARLQADRTLAAPTERSVLLQWPLRAANGLTDPGYHVVTRFVDHALSFPGTVLDYNCGDRTYDNEDGNHRGTDIYVWPFPWIRMDADEVEAIAAAAGTIVYRQDSRSDYTCCSGGSWNVIAVRHSDGSTSWYGHLKRFSLTPKGVGATVAAGEFLGVVGNSGCSPSPHLHLELYDGFGNLQDPFQGPCNTMNADSLWLDQPPYYEPAVNKIMTGRIPPDVPPGGCPATESPNELNVFQPGEVVYFSTFIRDMLAGQVATFYVRRPDLSLFDTWTYQLPPGVDHEPKTQLLQLRYVWDPHPPAGEWRFEVHFEGEVQTYPFYVNSWELVPAGRLGPDLRVGEPTLDNGLPLSWTHSSCNPGDISYAVFTGLIGYWNNHGDVSCEVEGTSFNVPLQFVSGNRYYLVAPRSPDAIGSYGWDSSGAERPPSVLNCEVVQLISCPEE